MAQLLLAVGLPAAVCAVILYAAWVPGATLGPRPGRGFLPPRGAWGGALGFAASFMIASLAAGSYPRLPPLESWHWIVHLVPVAAAVGLLESSPRLAGPWRWALLLLLACGCAIALVGVWVENHVTWRIVTAAVVLGLCAGLSGPGRRLSGASLPLCLWAAATTAAVVLLASGNARFAQLSGALSASLGGAVVLAWWRPAIAPLAGAVPVVSVALAGLLLSGYFVTWTDIPAWPFILTAAAPLAVRAGDLPPASRLRPSRRALVRLGAVGLLIAGPLSVSLVRLINEL